MATANASSRLMAVFFSMSTQALFSFMSSEPSGFIAGTTINQLGDLLEESALTRYMKPYCVRKCAGGQRDL